MLSPPDLLVPHSYIVVNGHPGTNRQGAVVRWLALLLLLVAGALVYTVVAQRQMNRPPPIVAEPRVVTPAPDLGGDEKATIEVFQNASPAVVHITTLAVRRDRLSLNALEIPQGTGSGFVWDQSGHIVTNFHVVRGADRAQVTLADGTVYAAKPVGVAPDKDLAVLRIDAPASALRPIAIGSSNNLQVGQKVLAIGNPFGLDQTLTTGVISGLGREINSVTNRTIYDVIQTDAPINPGNSGGPLLDSSGRLIGINTAILNPSGINASIGIGFAVPVDTVNRIVPDLLKDGRVERVGLGINVASDRISRQLNLDGVLIVDVTPNGAAANAGMVGTRAGNDGRWILGDVIVGVDGSTVRTSEDLIKALDTHRAGEVVKVAFVRGGERKEVSATLQSLP